MRDYLIIIGVGYIGARRRSQAYGQQSMYASGKTEEKTGKAGQLDDGHFNMSIFSL